MEVKPSKQQQLYKFLTKYVEPRQGYLAVSITELVDEIEKIYDSGEVTHE